MKKKGLIITISLLLVLSFAVGTTLAWLLDTTAPVVNTFAPSNINITLKETNADAGSETENTYKMLPGTEIPKDPKVTVLEGSEACWLYVKVIKDGNVDEYLNVEMAEGWVNIEDTDVWYYNDTIVQGTPIPVLAGNKVTVKDEVTKGMMNALEIDGATLPTITFQAYAVQEQAGADAPTAWDNTYGSDNP